MIGLGFLGVVGCIIREELKEEDSLGLVCFKQICLYIISTFSLLSQEFLGTGCWIFHTGQYFINNGCITQIYTQFPILALTASPLIFSMYRAWRASHTHIRYMISVACNPTILKKNYFQCLLYLSSFPPLCVLKMCFY